MTLVERKQAADSAQFHMPPQLADLSTIRQELQALLARSSVSGGLSSSMLSGDIGMLADTAERKIRSGSCHPNKMLDWLMLFQHPAMRKAAQQYRRIEDLIRLPLSENYINAVDTVWMVHGRFRPGNPNVPKQPPASLSILENKIEGGEFDANEYLVGHADRKSELGIRGEDRLSPLLLLSTGFYNWTQPTFDLMKVLLEKCADANAVDVRGFNALFYIVERGPWGRNSAGLERITRQLLDCTDLSHRDDAGRTLLHIAVERSGPETRALRPLLLQRSGEMRLDLSEKDSLHAKFARMDELGSGVGSASQRSGDRERKGDAQKVARIVMEHLRESKAKLRDIKAMFKQMDANGDGKLSPMEFAKGLRQYGIGYDESMEYADNLMEVMDRDNDNAISIEEFINMFKAEQIVRKFRDKLRGQDPHRVFDMLDTNQDGILSRTEFAQGLLDLGVTRGMSSGGIDDLMGLIDMDGNDAIDFHEFLEIVGERGSGASGRGGSLPTATNSRDSRHSDRHSDKSDRHRERRGSNASHHSVASHRSDRSSRQERKRELDEIERQQRQAKEAKEAAAALAKPQLTPEQRKAEAQRVTKDVMEQLKRATKSSGSKIKAEFRKMDKDRNGTLSAKEFAGGLRNLLGVDANTSWDYVDAMMPILDVDSGAPRC